MDVSLEEEPAKWRAKRKLPFRQVSFGLQQLIENGIAHHTKQLQDVLLDLQMSHDPTSLQSARENVCRVLSLLTQDLGQMEDMKENVRDEDINKFEDSAKSSRRGLHEAIQKAKSVVTADALRDQSGIVTAQEHDSSESNASTENENAVLQELLLVEENDDLYKRAEYLESLAQDMTDLKEMMVVLNENVGEQGEAVEAIEHHVENTAVNLSRGEVLLAQARYLKTAALPIVGLTVGFAAGGPIGAVAGVRVGFATSMIGGAIGYAGGKILHKMNNLTSFVPRLRSPTAETVPKDSQEVEQLQR